MERAAWWGGFLPIGYEEEKSIGEAIALQVIARYGGIVDQPGTRALRESGREKQWPIPQTGRIFPITLPS